MMVVRGMHSISITCVRIEWLMALSELVRAAANMEAERVNVPVVQIKHHKSRLNKDEIFEPSNGITPKKHSLTVLHTNTHTDTHTG